MDLKNMTQEEYDITKVVFGKAFADAVWRESHKKSEANKQNTKQCVNNENTVNTSNTNVNKSVINEINPQQYIGKKVKIIAGSFEGKEGTVKDYVAGYNELLVVYKDNRSVFYVEPENVEIVEDIKEEIEKEKVKKEIKRLEKYVEGCMNTILLYESEIKELNNSINSYKDMIESYQNGIDQCEARISGLREELK